MSNITAYPLQDWFETTLAQSWNGATGTVYLNTAPSFTFPVGVKTYIVVNPWKTNMQVGEIDSLNVWAKTVNVSSISIGSWAGTTYTQESHSVGSTVIISDNYQFWKNIIDAVNSKIDWLVQGIYFYADATARDAALWATPSTNGLIVGLTSEGKITYSLWGAWIDVGTWATFVNASTTVAGKVQLPDDAAVTAGTALWSSWAANVPTNAQTKKSISLKEVAWTLVDANEFVINQWWVDKRIAASLVAEYIRDEISTTQVAGENLTANDLAAMESDWNVYKTVRRATASAQIGTTTGLDSSANYNIIQTEYMSNDKVVVAYKKSSDDRIYARIVTFNRLTPTVGTEQVISTAMNGSDWVNMCVLSASLFVVTYRKNSDTFQYAVACTVSGTTITAGTEVLMYGTAVAWWSAVSGSICKVSATSFMSLPVANAALDPIAIIWTISGTVITAGSSVALEATTVAGSTRCCYIQDWVVAAFWDNSTNIKWVILEISWTTITANTVLDTWFAGSLLWWDRVLYIDWGRILIVRNGNNILVNTVNVPDQVAWTTMTVSATSAYVIPNDNTNSSYTCALYLGNNILAIANQKVWDSDVRFRTFDLLVASVKPIIDVTIAATAWEIALAALNTSRNKFMIAWRETGTNNANFSVYWDTSEQFIWAVKTTTLAAWNAPLLASWVVSNSGLTAWLPYYVWDAWAVATSWSRQIGTALSATTLLLN